MTEILNGRYKISPPNGGISLTVSICGSMVTYKDGSVGGLSVLTKNGNWVFQRLDDEEVLDGAT